MENEMKNEVQVPSEKYGERERLERKDGVKEKGTTIYNRGACGGDKNENAGEVVLNLDKTSTLTLTGDTYVKSLTNADTTNSNIVTNGYKLYVDGTPLK